MYSHQPRFISNESFEDVLIEQLRRTPWLLISAGLHGLLVIVLLLFIGDSVQADELTQAKVSVERDLLDDQIEDVKPPDQTEPDDPQDDQQPVEFPQDDVDQTDDDSDFEEMTGESDFVGDVSMDSSKRSDAIGLGNTAGGGGGRGGRVQGRKRLGGRKDQIVVTRGLDWLARHQSPDGSWDADGYARHGDPKLGPLCDGKGNALYDVGVSGLSLLCFLGAGETHKAGKYRLTVARGLKWLMDRQDAEGCFGSRSIANHTYNHAIAALAMVEAYGLTESAFFKKSAEKALAYVASCQNPYKAWRYGCADGQNDTSVTGWMVMALKAGKSAGIEVDERRLEWAKSFIEEMTDQETGRTGYVQAGSLPVRETGKKEEFPSEESESLTAVGIMTRIFCGEDPNESRMIKLGADLCSKKLPVWDRPRGGIDMYYWYYATLAMFQVGGQDWKRWNEAMRSAVIETQREDGNFAGSWDPVGAWGDAGGRVYSTALMTLCLEVYYRYGRVFGTGG